MNRQLDALARKVVFGSPPGPTAASVDKLLFARRFWARLLVLLLIALLSGVALGAPTFLWIALGVGTACWLVGAVKLWADLRRERHRSDSGA